MKPQILNLLQFICQIIHTIEIMSTFNVLFYVVPCMITCSSGAYDMILSVNYQMVEGHFSYGIDNIIK